MIFDTTVLWLYHIRLLILSLSQNDVAALQGIDLLPLYPFKSSFYMIWLIFDINLLIASCGI